MKRFSAGPGRFGSAANRFTASRSSDSEMRGPILDEPRVAFSHAV